jgi:hypothetical protein
MRLTIIFYKTEVFKNYDNKKEEVIRNAVDMDTGELLSSDEKFKLRGYHSKDDN